MRQFNKQEMIIKRYLGLSVNQVLDENDNVLYIPNHTAGNGIRKGRTTDCTGNRNCIYGLGRK